MFEFGMGMDLVVGVICIVGVLLLDVLLFMCFLLLIFLDLIFFFLKLIIFDGIFRRGVLFDIFVEVLWEFFEERVIG